MKDKTILEIPVKNRKNESVWIGIPEYQSYISIGIKKDEIIWISGMSGHHNEEWPSFVHTWYIAQVYAQALEKCTDSLLSGMPLLHAAMLSFKPYVSTINPYLLEQYVSKQEITRIRSLKPPLEYLIQVITMAQEERLLIDSSLTKNFLITNYYTGKEVNDALKNLKDYEHWRNQLAAQ